MMTLWKNPLWGVFLWPFSLIYRGLIRFRSHQYKHELKNSARLSALVMSVGNITVGGTGKTPLVETLAEALQGEGHRVGILSRGYGRLSDGITVVSDGRKLLVSPQEAGDEPYLLARRLSGIPVVVGRDRIETGRKAIRDFGCDTLILDDGFQHFRIKRDLDIVTIDATNPWGNGRLLPAGPLREPLSGLKRADAIVLTRIDQVTDLNNLKSQVRRWTDAPILESVHKPLEWVAIRDNQTQTIESFRGKRVLAFAGIGNPESFQRTLDTMGVDVMEMLRFRDHHWHSQKDIAKIINKARQLGTVAIVTTEKDGIRIPIGALENELMYFLKITCEIRDGIVTLERILESVTKS
jgi:tetraacyldisaccharide 4'-kinase